MLTLGTGTRLPEDSLLPLKLMSAHCYAVIGQSIDVSSFPILIHIVLVDVNEEEEDRYVTILDNWVESTQSQTHGSVESGFDKLSLEDTVDCRPGEFDLRMSVLRFIVYVASCRVSWDTVCAVFDGLFLSWDPAIFKHQLQFHG